jgi:hypothetical protein
MFCVCFRNNGYTLISVFESLNLHAAFLAQFQCGQHICSWALVVSSFSAQLLHTAMPKKAHAPKRAASNPEAGQAAGSATIPHNSAEDFQIEQELYDVLQTAGAFVDAEVVDDAARAKQKTQEV